MERLALDRHYFAKPVRTLFNDVRSLFPMSEQLHVYRCIERNVTLAAEYVDTQARVVLPRDHPQWHVLPASAASGQQVLPLAQAPRGAEGSRTDRSLILNRTPRCGAAWRSVR